MNPQAKKVISVVNHIHKSLLKISHSNYQSQMNGLSQLALNNSSNNNNLQFMLTICSKKLKIIRTTVHSGIV